jgi:hypothetical protein
MDTQTLRTARQQAVALRATLYDAQARGAGPLTLLGFAAAAADDALELVDRALAGLCPHRPGLLPDPPADAPAP